MGDEFGLPIRKTFSTAVEARRHVLKRSRKVIDTAAKLATGELPLEDFKGDPDVLRQYMVIVGKLKTSDDPVVIPQPVLTKLREQPEKAQENLEILFMSFLEGEIPLSQLRDTLEGYSYLFELREVREIAELLREQKARYGRR